LGAWALDGVVLALASVLLLANLGDQRLWQDEAQTALIAGTILTHGVPLGRDGGNSFSQETGKELGPRDLYVWHPWLVFYVLAGFFAVLGKGTLAARLPFALFGIATVVLTYHLGTSLWRSRRAGLLAAGALLLNVPFLVLARQCRYYAPGMFFALLALCGYWGMLGRRRYAGVTFAVAAIALFHTHYMQYAALLAAAGVHALLFRRDRIGALLLAAGVTAAVNAPWMIWFATLGRTLGTFAGARGQALELLGPYLAKIGQYAFPPLLLLLVPLAVWKGARAPREDRDAGGAPWTGAVLLLLFAAATLAATCLTSPFPFFRYVAPVLPAAALATGWLLDAVVRVQRTVGAAVALSILVALGYAWSVPDYLYELTHHYVGPIDGIVTYLTQHARRGDVVAMTYGDLPVKFYTGLRVVGGLTGEDLEPAKTAEWVVVRKYVVSDKDLDVRNYLLSEVPLREYTPVRIDAPDIPFQNREEPGAHLFRTAREDPVIILHRTAAPQR
jgi:4-amino-4-deoxy-L-arabinose transferase-like glycosyltransferase